MSIKRYAGPVTGVGGQTMPFARATEAGGFLYISGQTPMRDGEVVPGGIEVQTRQTFANLQAILDEAGYTFDDVVKVNAWLDDTRDFAGFNRVFKEYFDGRPPARSTVHSALMVDGKVEIDLIAYREPK
ncbi:RidA family protein [Marinobacter nanhaiticus D15-8W]|uniref:RidA family protein n=1 Tax=Marinobacter nanhaiticus D15-8W TaxID=626887 RepID=N6VYG8_9GAMM|nr:RidA family protein [Marinobacter nanhaiticus]ENO12919.1 RidA family protein [Marinobacter nanhaiticus D15-8W]BES70270.1 RidA family protein [Marinobacter nanhaiticus D15-8W]